MMMAMANQSELVCPHRARASTKSKITTTIIFIIFIIKPEEEKEKKRSKAIKYRNQKIQCLLVTIRCARKKIFFF